jgi:hypothetical protein
MDTESVICDIATVGISISIIMLFVVIGMLIYNAILHPIDFIIALFWVSVIIAAIWFIANYILGDIIAGLIFAAIAPGIIANVIAATPEPKKKKHKRHFYDRHKQNT